MRKLLVGLLVVLLVLIALPIAFLAVPTPLQRLAVERGAAFATGRAVTLGEPFRISVWPPLSITATDVRVANAAWGKGPDLVRVDALELGADLLTYFTDGLVKLDRLVVRRPQVNLEVAEDGRRNWQFGNGGPEPEAPADEPAEVEELPGFVLGDIRIEGGAVAYDDRAAGTSRRVENVDLAVAQPAAGQPLALTGGLLMDGKRATLAGSFANPGALAAGEDSQAKIELGLPGGKITYDGTLNSAGPSANGAVAIAFPNPRELLAWLGQNPALPDDALKRVGLQTRLALSAERVALDELRLDVDGIAGLGRVAVALGQPPKVEGELAFNRLTLDAYLPPEQQTALPTEPTPDQGWSTEPIELPLPLPVDLDFRVRAEGLKARQLETGRLAVLAQADRQRAAATLEELQLYEGGVTASAEARPGERATYTAGLRGDGIRLLPALRGLAGQERLDGTANFQFDATAEGNSQQDLVSSLDGTGKVLLRDGAILGINIAAMIRQVMTVGLSSATNAPQRTDFAEAGGSFRIEDGIVRNDDLFLRAPVLRLEGAGTVDLPRRTVDYRIRPQVAATLQGQDAAGESGLQAGIPFLIQGPLDAPAVRFDLDGLLTGPIRSPADLARVAADLAKSPKAVGVLKDRFKVLERLPDAGKAKALLEGALGSAGGGGPRLPGGDAPAAVEERARGLLQGLGR